MPETAKSSEVVRTGIFPKLVRVPIDADETAARKMRLAEAELQIDALTETLKPAKEKITALRADKRKLKQDIREGTTEQECQVYELKDFGHGIAAIHDAETDEKLGERTLEKKDYQADVEDRPETDA